MGTMKFAALILRPHRRAEFEKVSPMRRDKMGFFKELERKARKRPHFMQEYGEGVDGTIQALKEMMVGNPLDCEIQHTIDKRTYPGEEMPVTDLFWGDGQLPWSEGHIGTDGEQVYVIVVRTGGTKDDIPSTDVQVCPEAEEENRQGV